MNTNDPDLKPTTAQEFELFVLMNELKGASKEQLLELFEANMRLIYIQRNFLKNVVNYTPDKPIP